MGTAIFLTQDRLLEAFRTMKNEVVQKQKQECISDPALNSPGVQFTSYKEYREAMQRHKRRKDGSTDILSMPITSNEAYGWNASSAPPIQVFAKKSCPETLYASALVKSGIYF